MLMNSENPPLQVVSTIVKVLEGEQSNPIMIALAANDHNIALVISRVIEQNPDECEESILFENQNYVEDVFFPPCIQLKSSKSINIEKILKKWNVQLPNIKFTFQKQFPSQKKIKFWVLNAFREIILPQWNPFGESDKEWNLKEIVEKIPEFATIINQTHLHVCKDMS